MIQQRDVLFHEEKIPNETLDLIKSNVIQEGEHTGHAHRLDEGEYQYLVNPKTKARYLKLLKPTTIRHEEHKPIELPAGDYRIGIVKEYDHFEEEVRSVVD